MSEPTDLNDNTIEQHSNAPSIAPATVHLVGIEAVEPDSGDMDDLGRPQKVLIAFADRDAAQGWADRHNATIPWSPETKVVVLDEIPHVPAGALAPEPEPHD